MCFKFDNLKWKFFEVIVYSWKVYIEDKKVLYEENLLWEKCYDWLSELELDSIMFRLFLRCFFFM